MKTLINGAFSDTISVNDRGLLYGDGVFRTLLLRHGKIQQWHRHYARLLKDCNTLNLACPPESLLYSELQQLVQAEKDGVVKIIITRGPSERGYTPSHHATPTRIISLNSLPNYPESNSRDGVIVQVCNTKIARQPKLSGVKHLNRLENVISSSEIVNPEIAEGIMLDEADFVIEGIRSNIFMVKNGDLMTPDLSRCGVSGVQRERLIEWAAEQGVICNIVDIPLPVMLEADEIFLVNSVIGLWPIKEIAGCYHSDHHPIANVIQDWLNSDVTE